MSVDSTKISHMPGSILNHFKYRIILVLAFTASSFVVLSGSAHAAACTPASGLGAVTNTGIPITAAGTYKVWVRMKAADSINNTVGLEAYAPGALPNCLAAGGTGLSTTAWTWKLAGEAMLGTTGNTFRLVGLQPNVQVDRVLPVMISNMCTPDNIRNASTGYEPGDNCLQSKATSVSPSSPPPATNTPLPTITIAPSPSPVADSSPPVGPASIGVSLGFDWARSHYGISLSWAAATDKVGVTGYRVFRNNIELSRVTGLGYSDYAISPDTSYTYKVIAEDAAGNKSIGSTSAVATVRCFWIFCGLN